MNTENEKVFSVIKDALRHFPPEWVIVSANDGMIDVDVNLPSHKIAYFKSVARCEKCDLKELTDMLNRIGVHFQLTVEPEPDVLDYKTFVEEVKTLIESVNEQISSAMFTIDQIDGKGTNVLALQGKAIHMVVALPLRTIYQQYCKRGNFNDTLQSAITFLLDNFKEKAVEILPMLSPNVVKDSIVFSLVNKEKYMDRIQEVPHREFCDMFVIYRWEVPCEDNGERIFYTIDNDVIKTLEMTEAELYQLAKENTRKLFSPQYGLMSEAAEKYCDAHNDNKSAELDEKINYLKENGLWENYIPNKIWYLSNSRNIFGTSMLLYEDILQELAEKIGHSLLICPASVHALTVVPDNEWYPMTFAKMMQHVNAQSENELKGIEMLTNSVYHYNKDTRQIDFFLNLCDEVNNEK